MDHTPLETGSKIHPNPITAANFCAVRAHEEDGARDGAALGPRLRGEGGEVRAEVVQRLLREGPTRVERGRVRSQHEARKLRRGKAAAAAVAVVPRRVVPGGHDEAGRGGRRGRSL
jgi:hypothetical protein